ncbi:MAG TPA: D-alanyl-D-alanine carboxypeptidase family protein [Terrimicrobiaceae bacterium]|jgi:D-alanyl-D-alanine carboxypeptidase (penicillin-binding protein 5/6)|nr:D-alanyl-D-alanine carboxypeptidase family protein [Terrimicrobiaceae bacterium]
MKILPAVLLFGLLVVPLALPAQEPIITAESAVLFDANTGRVIYRKNENVRRAVASTQKLLTALIIAESGDLSAPVVIEQTDMMAAPTKLYVKTGERYTRQQLLTALLVKSPNDVARALARDNAGSIEDFAAKMNARMARMGGESSHFVNPNGLPADDQYSTARDMARVARAAYFNPLLREIMRTKHCMFRYATGKTIPLQNTNRVLRTYSFCNGMKTGYTDAAGHCLVSSGSWGGKDMIAVVLGSNKARVWQESALLLAYGLGIDNTHMASLRVSATSRADGDE